LSAKKNWLYTKLTIWQEKKYIQLASGCIAVSEGIREFADATGSKKTITILNGISNDFFKLPQKVNTEKIKIVYVGTYTSWDGAKYIPDLALKNPNVEFYMIGDGPNKKAIESISPSNVFYLGYKKYNDLKTIYQYYDAGIVLYDIDRNDMKISSLKTLEYMASGLPIFTTDVPGQEFVRDNKIGICTTFEELDENFQTFLNKLNIFKSNLEIFRQQDKDNFSWNGVAIKTKQFIKQVK
jgi:glycosyltransferase involved in cell wall biosynthesis